jgi:hypothetical protein
MIKNVYWYSCIIPLLLSYFDENCIFSTDLKKMFIYLMKIRPVVADILHADRRTDRYEEGNSRFSKSCERT